MDYESASEYFKLPKTLLEQLVEDDLLGAPPFTEEDVAKLSFLSIVTKSDHYFPYLVGKRSRSRLEKIVRLRGKVAGPQKIRSWVYTRIRRERDRIRMVQSKLPSSVPVKQRRAYPSKQALVEEVCERFNIPVSKPVIRAIQQGINDEKNDSYSYRLRGKKKTWKV